MEILIIVIGMVVSNLIGIKTGKYIEQSKSCRKKPVYFTDGTLDGYYCECEIKNNSPKSM